MEPVSKTKFMRNFTRHEAKVDEVLLEVMTQSSKERDNEGDKNLLNEYEGDNEMYEMEEHNICNMAVSNPGRRLILMMNINLTKPRQVTA